MKQRSDQDSCEWNLEDYIYSSSIKCHPPPPSKPLYFRLRYLISRREANPVFESSLLPHSPSPVAKIPEGVAPPFQMPTCLLLIFYHLPLITSCLSIHTRKRYKETLWSEYSRNCNPVVITTTYHIYGKQFKELTCKHH